MNQPFVCIIILNWNGFRNTLECIESVKKITYPSYKIIVVDNASANNEAYSLRKNCSGDIDILLTAKNYGYTGGNNVGISYALEKYDPGYILILNNDIIVDPDFLTIMVNVAQSDEKTGIVGGKVYYHRYPNLIQAAGAGINMYFGKSYHIGDRQFDKGQYDTQQSVDYVMGCCMLIKREVINKIGLLDEQFFCYWDETDYCFRCRKAGYNVVYTPLARVWHKNPVKLKIWERTQNKSVRSAIPYYYTTRNNFLFMRKHARGFEFLTFILYFFSYNLIFVTGVCLVFHRDITRFKSFLRGILDGIKFMPKKVCDEKEYILLLTKENEAIVSN
jgi:hypothetical protein